MTSSGNLQCFLAKQSAFRYESKKRKKRDFLSWYSDRYFKNYSGWAVKSNRESGDGYADILLKPKNPDVGIVIELKYAHSMNELDKACERAMEQIKNHRYDAELREDGRKRSSCIRNCIL